MSRLVTPYTQEDYAYSWTGSAKIDYTLTLPWNSLPAGQKPWPYRVWMNLTGTVSHDGEADQYTGIAFYDNNNNTTISANMSGENWTASGYGVLHVGGQYESQETFDDTYLHAGGICGNTYNLSLTATINSIPDAQAYTCAYALPRLIKLATDCLTNCPSQRTLYLRGVPPNSPYGNTPCQWETDIAGLSTGKLASVYTCTSSSSNTAFVGCNETNLPYHTDTSQPQGWAVSGGLWVLDWQFDSVPQLPAVAAATAVPPDTDLDGLVNIMQGPYDDQEPYGSICYLPDWNQPFVRIPLVNIPSHGEDLVLKVELTSGRGQGLPYRYAVPGLIEQFGYSHYGTFHGPNIFLNTDTRVVEYATITNNLQHVKQVSILRPNGRLVVFDFPWTNGAFSVFGYPTGPDVNRTYVLQDMSPINTPADFIYNFRLLFQDGIYHDFGRPWYEATSAIGRLNGGRYQAGPATFNALGGGGMGPPGQCWQDVSIYQSARWQIVGETGVAMVPHLSQVRLDEPWENNWLYFEPHGAIGTDLQYDGFILQNITFLYDDNTIAQTEIERDGEGNISALTKSGFGAEAATVTVNRDERVVTHGWGTESLDVFSQSGSGNSGSSTISYHTPSTTWIMARTFDSRERITSRTFATGGNSAISIWTWYDDNGHYAGGAPKWSRLHTFTPPIGPAVTYSYDPANGWLADAQTTWNGLPSEWRYDYTPLMAGDTPIPADPHELPRTADWYVNGASVRRILLVCTNGFYDDDRVRDRRVYGNANKLWSDPPLYETVETVYPECADSYGWETRPEDALLDGKALPWQFTSITSIAGMSYRSAQIALYDIWNDNESDYTYWMDASGVAINAVYSKGDGYNGIYTNEFSRTVDPLGRPLVTTWFDGTTDSSDNYCLWGPQSITRRDQTTAGIQYDAFGRINSITEPVLGRTTTITADPLGLQTTRTIVQGGVTRTTTAQNDIYGRPVSYSDPLASNSWVYSQNTDGSWIITQHRSGLGDIVTETYSDGGIKKVYGAGAQQCIGYAWSVQNGCLAQVDTVLNADGTPTSESATTVCNAIGLPASIQQAGVASPKTIQYDTAGRPQQSIDESGITIIQNYDPIIGISTNGVKVAGDPSTLSAAGSDRITQHTYTIDNSGETRGANIFLTNGSDTATPLLTSFGSFDGRQSSLNFAGRTVSAQASAFTGPAAFSVDSLLPNGGSTHATYGPLGLASLQKKDSSGSQTGQTTFTPDAGGLSVQIQDSVRGSQNLAFDPAGRLQSSDASSSGGSSSTVQYLPGTDLPTSITGGGKSWSCQYYPNGLPQTISASGSPTATYAWDTLGRLASVTLTSSTGTITTSWNRDSQAGRLVNKMVNGAIVESYAWQPNGQPAVVTRPNGTVSNQYNAAGDCAALVDTPANYAAEIVTATFDRPGYVIGHAVAGGIAESYANYIDGTLLGVQVTGNGVVPDYSLDLPQNLTSGQALGYTLTQGSAARTAAVSYDGAGKITNIVDGVVAAAYQWTPGGSATNLTLAVSGAPCLTLANNWNEALGVRTNIAYSVNDTPLAFFAFSRSNGTSQITRITREDGSTREISYDDGGRLTGWKYKNLAGTADYDRSWLFNYDGAGNLTSAGHDATIPGGPSQLSPLCKQYATQNIRITSEFTVDAYNFLTVRKWNAVDLVCYAAANARITVNGLLAHQNGTRFVVSIPLAPSDTAHVTNLVVCAVMNGSNTNIESYYTNTVQLTLPAYPESIQTALASAVTSDSVMEYLYDARNQLRRVTDKLGATAQRLQSVYDYYPDGRRARKSVTVWNGSAWQPYRTCQYIYDRWNLIREIVTENGAITTRDYTWGLDLTGMRNGAWRQDAGGIGGLLAITEVTGSSTNIFLPLCDQVGTINSLVAVVTNNMTLATPAIVATYEYDPFGELIAQTGPYANSCPFSFQTKYRDCETGLSYFGYRFYDPKSGKFRTTDPLGEEGGLNLTAFCSNDPVNNTDSLGLVLCAFDGTGNDAEKDQFTDPNSEDNAPSNVPIMADLYQGKAIYEWGVGTRTDKGKWFWKGIGGWLDKETGLGCGQGTAKRANRMMADLKAYLANHPDEPVDIIGFSRGAASARNFANRIHKELPAAKIRFLGLFDTVAQIGVPNRANYQFGYDLSVHPDQIGFIAHAVAKDDHRGLFPLTSISSVYKQGTTSLVLLVPRNISQANSKKFAARIIGKYLLRVRILTSAEVARMHEIWMRYAQ